MPRPTTPPLSISIRRPQWHNSNDDTQDDEQEYNNKNISSEACYYNDTSSSSSSTNESTISSIGIDDDECEYEDSSTNYNSDIKMKEVTITVLSMHGIIIKRSQKSKKKKKRLQIEQQGEEGEDDRFSVVASFMQSISNERVFQTHVPSLQVDLQSNHDANNSSSSSQPIIHWPPHPKKKNESATQDEHQTQALSTLKFIGDFLPEEEEEDSLLHSEEEEQRFIPKTCPINLSILRNGKMITIGSINLIVNGEENGMMSINVPITNTIKQNSKLNRAGGGKTTLLKKSMAKIKGDVYKFGIAEDAMIRVLVKVTPVLPHHNNEHLDINRFGASDAAVQNYISTIEEEDDGEEDLEEIDVYDDLVKSLQEQLDQKDVTIQNQQKELVESKNTFIWTLRRYNKTIQSLRNELDMVYEQNKRLLHTNNKNSEGSQTSCGMMTNPQQADDGPSILSRVRMLQQQQQTPTTLPLPNRDASISSISGTVSSSGSMSSSSPPCSPRQVSAIPPDTPRQVSVAVPDTISPSSPPTYSRRMSDPGFSKDVPSKSDTSRRRSSMDDCDSDDDNNSITANFLESEDEILKLHVPPMRRNSTSSSSSSVSTTNSTGSSRHAEAKTTSPNNKPKKMMTLNPSLNPRPSPPPPPRRAVSHGSALSKHLTRGRQSSLSEGDTAAHHQRSHSSSTSSSTARSRVCFSSTPVVEKQQQTLPASHPNSPSTSTGSCSGSSSVNSSACTKSVLKIPKYKASKEKMRQQMNEIEKVTTMSMDLSSFSLDLNIEGDVTKDLGDSYNDSLLDVAVGGNNKHEYDMSRHEEKKDGDDHDEVLQLCRPVSMQDKSKKNLEVKGSTSSSHKRRSSSCSIVNDRYTLVRPDPDGHRTPSSSSQRSSRRRSSSARGRSSGGSTASVSTR